jgi:hypothetical protein
MVREDTNHGHDQGRENKYKDGGKEKKLGKPLQN